MLNTTSNSCPRCGSKIVIDNDRAERIVEAIRQSAHTGKIGDGKIFVYDVEQAIRIRTGETGDDAV